MGRIEDALKKLQLTRPHPELPSTMNPVAQVVAENAKEHSYGGRLIEVNAAALIKQGLLAPEAQQRMLAEEYRAIKRPLLRNAGAGPDEAMDRGNLLMVASAVPGEGKTFTCVNLSLSIAREKDWSVVLVDADCLKPQLTHLFGAEDEPGLLDILRDSRLDIESLIMPTNVEGLAVLPAGKPDQHSAELLASARMRALCESLAARDRRRMVVFDSAPLLLTTEAVALASQVGQVLVVVRANKTQRQIVVAALEKLDPAKAINLVLNKAGRSKLRQGNYGSYQAYGA